MDKFNEQYLKMFKEYIPDILYHATYKPLLKSIKEKGLGNTDKTYWIDSKPGVVYLAASEDIAISYAEVNEQCPEEWLDQIVVLKIDVNDLDIKKLSVDKNVKLEPGEEPETFEYYGIITKFQIV